MEYELDVLHALVPWIEAAGDAGLSFEAQLRVYDTIFSWAEEPEELEALEHRAVRPSDLILVVPQTNVEFILILFPEPDHIDVTTIHLEMLTDPTQARELD